ncbi:MAG: FliH/SctL family protein [Longimicrobiales bacterium]
MAGSEVVRREDPWVWEELSQATVGGSSHTDVSEDDGGADATPAVPSPEELIDDAFRDGYERGLREGEALGTEALRPALSAVAEASRQLEEARLGMLADLERNTAALAVGIARELVVSELEHSPEVVAELVREGVSAFSLDAPLTVRLSPADLALLVAGGDSALSGSRDVKWEPDPRVGRGGCLVEGPGMIVDGRLDLALERVYRAVVRD